MREKGILLDVSGFSGSGKGTIGGRERNGVLPRACILYQESAGASGRNFNGVGWAECCILDGGGGRRGVGVVDRQKVDGTV